MNKYTLPMVMKINSTLKAVTLALLAVLVPIGVPLWAAGQGDDVILKAMTDEMVRSTTRLKMENLNKPYYLDYTINDREMMLIKASFGGIIMSGNGKNRDLSVSVRVGDYTLDNTNLPYSHSEIAAIPVDNDYDAIRQVLWLTTDQAYKNALENLSKKKAILQNVNLAEQIDSFSREDKPAKAVLPDIKINWNKSRWEQACRSFSSIFKMFPKINDSSVLLSTEVSKRYFISSEGAQIIGNSCLCRLVIAASTQSVDGMELHDFVTFYVSSPDDLPKSEEIVKQAETMAQRLSAQSAAPVLESYIGPVIFEGQAAGEFFRQLLGKNLCGVTPPIAEDKMQTTYLAKIESGFKNKIGLRVLPPFIDVVADPLTVKYGDQILAGSYTVDDEGVSAQKVQLVEKGILRGFLLSRTPVKGFNRSNGHGRSCLSEPCRARLSNLFVLATSGKKNEELKEQLIDLCKQQNREYGLIISSLKQADLPFSENDIMMQFLDPSGTKQTLLPKPLMLHKVFTDGHTEPVRGVEFGEITLNLLKDIVAATDSCYVHHFKDTLYAPIMMPTFGVPASIVAPSVLLEEIELKKINEPQQKPPFLPHPYFK